MKPPCPIPTAPDPASITRPGTIARQASVEGSAVLAGVKARSEEDDRLDPSRKPMRPRGDGESPEEALRELAQRAIDTMLYDAGRGVAPDPLSMLRWTKVLQATGGGGGGDAAAELAGLSDRDLDAIEAILTRSRPPEPPPEWAAPLSRVRAADDAPSPILALILRMIDAQLIPEFSERGECPGPIPPAAIREIEDVLANYSVAWRWQAGREARR
jgi:hypothetical protein